MRPGPLVAGKPRFWGDNPRLLRNSFPFLERAKAILSQSKDGFCGPGHGKPARNRPSTGFVVNSVERSAERLRAIAR